MGYIARNVTSDAAKEANASVGMLFRIHDWYQQVSLGSLITIFKITVDVSDMEYLYLLHQADANGRFIKLSVGSTTTGEVACGTTRTQTSLDISSETGNQEIKLEIKGNGVDDYHAYDIDLYHMEA